MVFQAGEGPGNERLGTFLADPNSRGGGATGIQRVEAKDVAKHSTMHRTPSLKQRIIQSQMIVPKVEDPYLILTQKELQVITVSVKSKPDSNTYSTVTLCKNKIKIQNLHAKILCLCINIVFSG